MRPIGNPLSAHRNLRWTRTRFGANIRVRTDDFHPGTGLGHVLADVLAMSYGKPLKSQDKTARKDIRTSKVAPSYAHAHTHARAHVEPCVCMSYCPNEYYLIEKKEKTLGHRLGHGLKSCPSDVLASDNPLENNKKGGF